MTIRAEIEATSGEVLQEAEETEAQAGIMEVAEEVPRTRGLNPDRKSRW